MSPTISVEDAVSHYLKRKASGTAGERASGTYAAKAELILGEWRQWLEDERAVRGIDEVDVESVRAYATELAARTEDGLYTASTANTYYAVVRSFLSWCADAGLIRENPAVTDRAREPLPLTGNSSGAESASSHAERVRNELVAAVRERALPFETGDRDDRLDRVREYAMVSLLAYSAVRGAELFRVPADDRRTGATWADVDFYTGTIRVLGKSQRREVVQLPAAARTPLRRYRVLQDPPTTDWPLFPTHHAPSVAKNVRSSLRSDGHTEADVEAILEGTTAAAVARKRSIPPPALTTEGARSILKRLSAAVGLDEDSYVTPKGVRGSTHPGERLTGDAVPESDLLSPTPTQSVALRETFRETLGAGHVDIVVED